MALPLSATSLTKLKCSSLLTLILFCSEAAEVCYGAETAPGAADKCSSQSVSKWKKIDGLPLLFKCFLNTFSCIMWPADLPHQSPHQTHSPQPQFRKMCMAYCLCLYPSPPSPFIDWWTCNCLVCQQTGGQSG